MKLSPAGGKHLEPQQSDCSVTTIGAKCKQNNQVLFIFMFVVHQYGLSEIVVEEKTKIPNNAECEQKPEMSKACEKSFDEIEKGE